MRRHPFVSLIKHPNFSRYFLYMETFTFVILGFVFPFYALHVDSLARNVPSSPSPAPQSPVPTPFSPSPLPKTINPSSKTLPPPESNESLPPRLPPKWRRPPPPPESQNKRMNNGKKIGFLFVGIAGIFQIGVVSFLAFKRWQLLRIKDRYDTSSS